MIIQHLTEITAKQFINKMVLVMEKAFYKQDKTVSHGAYTAAASEL